MNAVDGQAIGVHNHLVAAEKWLSEDNIKICRMAKTRTFRPDFPAGGSGNVLKEEDGVKPALNILAQRLLLRTPA